MKLFKKIFKVFGIFFILLIAAIILIPIIFKGKILEIAQEQANKNMNAVVKFKDLNLSMIRSFPDLSVELEELSVVGKDTFATDTLIKFKSFYVGLNLMSVISGDEMKINAIILDSPKISAKVLANGLANWDIAIADTTAQDSLPADTTKSEDAKFKINLKKFEIKNANITYDDKTSDMLAEIRNFNFLLKGDMSQDFTNLDIKTTLDTLTVKMGAVKYLNKAKIAFNSQIAADLKNSKYEFKENIFKLNEIELAFEGNVEMPDTNIVTDIKFKTSKTEFKSVLSLIPAIYMTDFNDIKTAGKFGFNGYAKGTYNAVNLPAFGIDFFVENAFFKYPDLPESVKNINIKLKVDAQEGTGENMLVNLQTAHVEMAKNPVDMKLIAKMTSADINLDGNVKGKIDLTSMKNIVPMEDMDLAGIITANLLFNGNLSDIENEQYENFKASGNFGIENFDMKSEDMPTVKISKADMDFSPQNVNLKQFDATAGKSDFHMNGTIDNILSYVFKDETLKGTFNFNSNLLDVNEFMGGETAETTETTQVSATQTETAESGALEIPKNINFTLNADIQKILYDKLEILKTEGLIKLAEGKMDLNKLRMNLLGGSMLMSGSYDSKDISKPLADFNFDIMGFDIKQVYDAFLTVQKLAPIAKNCQGNITAGIKMDMVLDNEMSPILNTLNSVGNFKSNNMSIKDNKLLNSIAKMSKNNQFKDPSLKNVNVSYTMKNGNLKIEPTKMKMADTELEVSGTQNLDMSIDFDLGMTIPKRYAGDLVNKIPGGSVPDNIEVTAKIGGTNTDPKIVNFNTNLLNGLKDAVEDKIKDKVEDVKKDVKAEADKIIAQARTQANRVISEGDKQAQNIISAGKQAGNKVISEAQNQGNRLIREAGKNPLKKKAAQIASKKLVEQAKKQAKNLNNEAKKNANKVKAEAKKQSDKIMADAQKRVDNL